MKKTKLISAFLCCAIILSSCSTVNTEQTAETTVETNITAQETTAPETEGKEPLYIPESGMAKAEFCDEMKAKNSISALWKNYDSAVVSVTGTEKNGETLDMKITISEFEGKKAASYTCDFDDLKVNMFLTDTYAIQKVFDTNDFNQDISIIHPRYKDSVIEKLFINYFPEDSYICDIREENDTYVVEMSNEDEAKLLYYLNPGDFSLIKITGEDNSTEIDIDFQYNIPVTLDTGAYDAAFGGDDLVSITFCFDPDTQEEHSCTLKLNKDTMVYAYAEELNQYFYSNKEMTNRVNGISALDGATVYAKSEKTGEIVYSKPEE